MPDLSRRWWCCSTSASFLLAVVLSLGASSTYSHAVVVHSSLQDHPVKPETPTSVVLRFSLRIQLSFTKMILVDAGGKDRSLEFSAGSRPDEVEVKLPGLAAGPYVLRYKVLAIDGHLTEGVVRFRVAAPR